MNIDITVHEYEYPCSAGNSQGLLLTLTFFCMKVVDGDDRTEIPLTVNTNEYIATVKQRYFEKKYCDPEDYDLAFRGSILRDNDTVGGLEIENGCAVWAIITLRGAEKNTVFIQVRITC